MSEPTAQDPKFDWRTAKILVAFIVGALGGGSYALPNAGTNERLAALEQRLEQLATTVAQQNVLLARLDERYRAPTRNQYANASP